MKNTFGMNTAFLAVCTVVFWTLAGTVLTEPVSIVCGFLGLFSLSLTILNGVMAATE